MKREINSQWRDLKSEEKRRSEGKNETREWVFKRKKDRMERMREETKRRSDREKGG